jgi:hypothetical protein
VAVRGSTRQGKKGLFTKKVFVFGGPDALRQLWAK